MIDEVDEATLLSLLTQLKNFNLSNLKEKFQNIFSNQNITDLTKSLLIACLSDNKLDADFVVIKEEVLIKFNPSNVFDIRESENPSETSGKSPLRITFDIKDRARLIPAPCTAEDTAPPPKAFTDIISGISPEKNSHPDSIQEAVSTASE